MKIETKIPSSTRGAHLRSEAQEKLDASGGEKIAAKGARSISEAEKARYADAMDQRKALLDEAKQLRADAAEKLKGAVGARGLFGLENVARGFAKLMNRFSGNAFSVTVESLKNDPDAQKTAAQMEKLASGKEAAAQKLFETAQKSWVASTAALSKAEGHEKTAAAHAEAAAKLMKKAGRADALAHAAGAAAGAAKAGLEVLGTAVKESVKEVAKREGKALVEVAKQELQKIGDEALARARSDLRGLLQLGIDFLKSALDGFFDKVEGKVEGKPEPSTTKRAPRKKPVAEPPSKARVDEVVKAAAPHVPAEAQPKLADLGYTPGKVSFNGARAPREPVVLRGPRIDEPPKGEKKISESFLAARWAAEAAGIDWLGKGAGELKKLIETHKGGLKLSHGASPFEAKKRLAERMGLPTASEAIHAMSIDDVRQMFAQREAVGLPRLTSKVDLHKALDAAGVKRDAGLDELAMYGMAKGQQELASAAQALKADLQNADTKAAFDKAATALDRSKRVMLDVLSVIPTDSRHVLALDACDAVEAGHGKPGATTKLGFALETLAKSEKFSAYAEKHIGASRADWTTAAKASEWISLGELAAPSGVLAYPGPLTDAQRKDVIAPLSRAGTFMAKELALLDDAGVAALEKHQTFTPGAPAAAQLLGFTRQISALAERRDFRTKELLSKDEIVLELLKNAGLVPMLSKDGAPFIKSPPALNPALVQSLGEVVDEVLKSLR